MTSQTYTKLKPFFEYDSVRHFLKKRDMISLYELYFAKYGYNDTLTNLLVQELNMDVLKYILGPTLSLMFKNCQSIKGPIYFDAYPDLTRIGVECFAHCKNITEVDIGETIRDVQINAFDSCTGLERVNYDVRSISNGCFARCDSLKEVTIGPKVVSIGEYAFTEDSQLNLVDLKRAEQLHTVHRKAFGLCEGLTNLNFSNTKLTNIKANAFEDCTNLKSLHLPGSVLEIRSQAFIGCKSLDRIFYNGTLNDWMFVDCESDAFDHQVVISCTDGVVEL